MTTKKKAIMFAGITASFLLGGFVGVVGDRQGIVEPIANFIHLPVSEPPTLSTAVRRKGSFIYTNPLLECEQANSTLRVFARPFDDAADAHIAELKKSQPQLTDLGLQYRDLLSGVRYTYNEDFEFIPASLLKVPLLIAHLKRAEQDPTYLQQKVMFDINENTDAARNITSNTEPPLTLGEEYTIEDYLQRMIIYSSNRAALLLGEILRPEEVDRINQDLAINLKGSNDQDLTITVNDYASFFRILYNASYLSPQQSEYALHLLTQGDYTQGLVGGVPVGTVVAHKFGERVDAANTHQLHDCGIIYYPKRPYLLCIMTKGTDFSGLQASIKDLSAFFYNQVKKQYDK